MSVLRSKAYYDEKWLRNVEEQASGCWLWRGSIKPNGYGFFYAGVLHDPLKPCAHRYGYELLVGPIPDGLQLDHLCRNRACVNPDHLEPVTPLENVLRSESPSSKNARKTHCINGHAFDEENTRYEGIKRKCRACQKARRKVRHQATKTERAAA